MKKKKRTPRAAAGKGVQAPPARSAAENETAPEARPRTAVSAAENLPALKAPPRTVVLDVDNTLCGIEGVDWLATLRGPDIARKSAELTDRAMAGGVDIGRVYGERLAIISPTRDEVSALSQIYRERLAPGAHEVTAAIRATGARVILVSGGFRQAIAPVARELGFADADLFAVELRWNERGEYAGYDTSAPTARNRGKLDTVRALALERPIVAVGDGATDLDMREAVDLFIAFTGFTRRATVVANADREVSSFAELQRLLGNLG